MGGLRGGAWGISIVLVEVLVDVNNTVVLTIASLKYTVPYIVKYTYSNSTVLACMLV
jgi:hypothetical protein